MLRTTFMGSHRRIQAYNDIGAILGVGGAAYAIIPVGDQDHENAGRTTVTTVGQGAGAGLVFTYSEAITSWDTPPRYRHNQLGTPYDVSFNATDEEADTPDVAFWSRDDAGGVNGFSVGAWVNVTNSASQRAILGKWDTTTGLELREWLLFIQGSNDALRLVFYDESANVVIARESDAAITQGSLRFVVATYDGAGGPSAADTIALYDNGVTLTSSATNNASYVGMEDLATLPQLGFFVGASAPTAFFNGSMCGGAVGPFFTQRELTAAQVAELYRIGIAAQQ